MSLTKEEKNEIIKEIAKDFQKDFEKEITHLKNNISQQLIGFRKELENHSKDNKEANKAISIATDKLQKTVNELVTALSGTEYDKENSFFARFKRVEALAYTFKQDKSFVLGGWFAITVAVGGTIGFLITIYQAFKHLLK